MSPKTNKFEILREETEEYDAAPPNQKAYNSAIHILEVISELGLKPDKLVPSAEDGICICFSAGDRYAEFECFNTGTIVGMIEDSRKDILDTWTISHNDEEIQKSATKIKNLLGVI